MAIDREKIIRDLSEINIESNEDGLMPFYGVLLNRFPTNFWNSFSLKIIDAAGDHLYDSASGLLENAAAECGYHTGWGILNSEEFKAIVEPMIENDEDKLHGLFAIVTALGWAKADVVELIPGEKMVVRANNYYEADVKDQLSTQKPFAFMLTGISRAFMDLIYGDSPYPDGFDKFKCEQTQGIEIGDEYGEFVVTQ